MSTPDEQALWAAALAGDGEAFGQIFDRHRDRVFRHALRLVDQRADAEDVTAGAFLELWRRREDARVVSGTLLPWLLVTATNLARNVQRSTRRHRALLARLPRPGPAADPAQAYLDSRAFDGLEPELAAALRELPELDQQLLALTALEGFSQEEAGLALGLSASAVKSRLHRVRSRFRCTTTPHPTQPHLKEIRS